MAGAFSQAQRDIGLRLTALAKSHQDPQLKAMMGRLGKAGEQDARRAAQADLGGNITFSGWPEVPLETTTRYLGKGQQYVGPKGKSAGGWTVAQRGRNQGDAGGFAGPGVNRSTGLTARTKSGAVRKVRARGGRRWNGRTAPKFTADDAKAITERETPKRLRSESLKVITTAFKGGR